MGLVLRLEVQVGAAVLVENSSGRVADDGVFGFVHLGEDIVQGLQLLGREAGLERKTQETQGVRAVMREPCLAQPLAGPALLSAHP